MRVIKQAYDDNFHGNVFEELKGEITWQPLQPDNYDSWTLTCISMARNMDLLEADVVVQEPGNQAPPTREFKITSPKGQSHFLLVVPLLEIFFWINKEHTDTIHPDVALAETLTKTLGIEATVVVDDKRGSTIYVRNGPTIVDPRTSDDRRRYAERRRNSKKHRE